MVGLVQDGGCPDWQPSRTHACDHQGVSADPPAPPALDDPHGGAPEPSPGRSWPLGPLLWVAVVAAWCGVNLVRAALFFRSGNEILWLLAWFGVIGIAACATIALFGWQLSRRQWVRAAIAVVLAGLLGAATFAPNWTPILVHGYYQLHRHQFATVAAAARSNAPACSDVALPATSLSVTGRTQLLGGCPGLLAIYVPRELGLPDGGAGYGWFATAPPDDSQYIINADPGWTCWAVGDGWYWMESGNYPAPTMKARAQHC